MREHRGCSPEWRELLTESSGLASRGRQMRTSCTSRPPRPVGTPTASQTGKVSVHCRVDFTPYPHSSESSGT